MSQSSPARRVFDLEQPRTADMPIHPAHRPGYSYTLHRRHEDGYGEDGPRSGASGLVVMKEHAGTHIDALCHQSEHQFLCGGIPIDPSVQNSGGFSRLGVETIAPLVAPGVLLDIAGLKGADALPHDYAISVDELKAAATRIDATVALLHEGGIKVERIAKITPLGDENTPPFVVQPGFDAEKFRRDHLFVPEAAHPRIHLRFDPALSYEVRTRFDPARVTQNRSGGSDVVIENPLSDWLVNWVLSFGAGVEVLEPAELRQQVATRALQIERLHRPDEGLASA
jgi:hypothetical protein